MAKIIKLKAENVKRLEAVEILPDGNLVVIGGKNGAGKTSLLDSITMLLGGKRSQTEKPVHDGEESAYIEGVLDTNYIITKTINASGKEQLTISDKDGGKYSGGAQSFLDSIYNKATIDPRAFAQLDRDKRYKTLAEIAGVDPEPIERRILGLMEERRALNTPIQNLTGQVSGRRVHEDVPEQELSISEITAQIQTAHEQANTYHQAAERLKESKERYRQLQVEMDQLQQFMIDTTKWLEANPCPDLTKLNQAMSEIDITNRKVRDNIELAQLTNELKTVKKKYNELDKQIEEARAEKSALLDSAQYPIPGITLQDGEIYYEGIPFSEISASKRLILGAAIGFAQSPELRILLIKDAPYIDDQSMAMLEQLASQVDGQIWIEKGGEQGVTVVIEDGRVRA